MIAAIQLLKERPATNEQRLVAEFEGPVGFEIPIKHHRGEGLLHLFANKPETAHELRTCMQS